MTEMTKEYNKKYKEYLKKILSTCLIIGEQGRYYAWYEIAGHVYQISVRISLADEDTEWIFNKSTYFNSEWQTEAQSEQDLKNILFELKKYLKN